MCTRSFMQATLTFEHSYIIKIKMENKLLYKEGEDGEDEMMPIMLREREIDIATAKARDIATQRDRERDNERTRGSEEYKRANEDIAPSTHSTT